MADAEEDVVCPPVAAENNAEENNAVENLYNGAKLAGKCGCELCRSGVATTHNDDSHDQSLNQNFQLDGENPLKLDIVGGTTKCGRVMSNYFASLKDNPFDGSRGIEVGAGTGIVGMTLAHLGMKMVMTDMEVVLDTVEYNVNRNAKNIKDNVQIKPLLWGDEAYNHQSKESEVSNFDYVIGSDLIYAHETIADLVRTFEILSSKPLQDGSYPPVYIAVIRRFNWEQDFFDGMAVNFEQNVMLKFQEITIYRYERKSPFQDAVVEDAPEQAGAENDNENLEPNVDANPL